MSTVWSPRVKRRVLSSEHAVDTTKPSDTASRDQRSTSGTALTPPSLTTSQVISTSVRQYRNSPGHEKVQRAAHHVTVDHVQAVVGVVSACRRQRTTHVAHGPEDERARRGGQGPGHRFTHSQLQLTGQGTARVEGWANKRMYERAGNK